MENNIEQLEEVKEIKKKGGKGLIVLVILLLLICCGLGVFIFMNKDKLFEKEKEVVEKEVKKEEKVKEDSYKMVYNPGNVKNDEDGVFGMPSTYGISGVGYQVNEKDVKEVNVNINWDLVKKSGAYGDDEIKKADGSFDEYKIKFDKEVSDIYCGGIGQSISGNKVLFLMKDGTVEYIEEHEAVKNQDFNKHKVIDGLKSIVKFYSVAVGSKGSQIGGHYTILAQADNGDLYNIEKMIEE